VARAASVLQQGPARGHLVIWRWLGRTGGKHFYRLIATQDGTRASTERTVGPTRLQPLHNRLGYLTGVCCFASPVLHSAALRLHAALLPGVPWAGARLSLEGYWFASPPGAGSSVSLESSPMAAALLGPSCDNATLEAGLGVGGGLLLCSATASDSRRVPSSLAALTAAFSFLVRLWGCSSFGASGLGPV
jgi:hypothetical protein